MIKQPPYLKKGDTIAIVCPAKKLPEPIEKSIEIFKAWGLNVRIGESVHAGYHQFAGDDTLRARDIQQFLDDREVKAIIAARGGYGTIRIIDALNFSVFLESPKWLIGFSDITVLLSHALAQLHTESLHAQMPMTFGDATIASMESLKKALFGETLSYSMPAHTSNRPGTAEGVLIGGNLTLLCMVEGSESAIDYDGKILFIEDVGEHEFSIDRMLRMLKRSGKLAKLRGLIVGAFNEVEPEKIYFGQTPDEVVQEIVREYTFPVCYNFPVGHISDNLAMIVGRVVSLQIDNTQTTLKFL